MCLYVGFIAQVTVCGQVFTSSHVKPNKVGADQDAAKLAFEHLQQQQQQQQQNDGSDDTLAASKKTMRVKMLPIICSVELRYTFCNIVARFLKLDLSRESRVIPGTRNSSVLATANLGLSSE